MRSRIATVYRLVAQIVQSDTAPGRTRTQTETGSRCRGESFSVDLNFLLAVAEQGVDSDEIVFVRERV